MFHITPKIQEDALRRTLSREDDDTISNALGISKGLLSSLRRGGLFIKRKKGLEYLILNTLKKLGQYWTSVDISHTTVEYVISYLNVVGEYNPQNKQWTVPSFERWLVKTYIKTTKLGLCTESMASLDVFDIYNYHEYDPRRFDPSSMLKPLDLQVLQNVTIQVPEFVHTRGLNENEQKCKDFILQLLDKDPYITGNGITRALNNHGLTNKAGKDWGRWSVKLLLERLSIILEETEPVETVLHLFNEEFDKVPLNVSVNTLDFVNKHYDNFVHNNVRKGHIVEAIKPRILAHNKQSYRYELKFKYLERILHYIDTHKYPVSNVELSKYLGVTSTQAHRICTKLGICLWSSYLQQVTTIFNETIQNNPKCYMDDIVQVLNNKGYYTPRRKTWSYILLYNFYTKYKTQYNLRGTFGIRS